MSLPNQTLPNIKTQTPQNAPLSLSLSLSPNKNQNLPIHTSTFLKEASPKHSSPSPSLLNNTKKYSSPSILHTSKLKPHLTSNSDLRHMQMIQQLYVQDAQRHECWSKFMQANIAEQNIVQHKQHQSQLLSYFHRSFNAELENSRYIRKHSIDTSSKFFDRHSQESFQEISSSSSNSSNSHSSRGSRRQYELDPFKTSLDSVKNQFIKCAQCLRSYSLNKLRFKNFRRLNDSKQFCSLECRSKAFSNRSSGLITTISKPHSSLISSGFKSESTRIQCKLDELFDDEVLLREIKSKNFFNYADNNFLKGLSKEFQVPFLYNNKEKRFNEIYKYKTKSERVSLFAILTRINDLNKVQNKDLIPRHIISSKTTQKSTRKLVKNDERELQQMEIDKIYEFKDDEKRSVNQIKPVNESVNKPNECVEGSDKIFGALPYLSMRSLKRDFAVQLGFPVEGGSDFIFPPQKYNTNIQQRNFGFCPISYSGSEGIDLNRYDLEVDHILFEDENSSMHLSVSKSDTELYCADDELCSELQLLQQELRSQIDQNNRSKRRILSQIESSLTLYQKGDKFLEIGNDSENLDDESSESSFSWPEVQKNLNRFLKKRKRLKTEDSRTLSLYRQSYVKCRSCQKFGCDHMKNPQNYWYNTSNSSNTVESHNDKKFSDFEISNSTSDSEDTDSDSDAVLFKDYSTNIRKTNKNDLNKEATTSYTHQKKIKRLRNNEEIFDEYLSKSTKYSDKFDEANADTSLQIKHILNQIIKNIIKTKIFQSNNEKIVYCDKLNDRSENKEVNLSNSNSIGTQNSSTKNENCKCGSTVSFPSSTNINIKIKAKHQNNINTRFKSHTKPLLIDTFLLSLCKNKFFKKFLSFESKFNRNLLFQEAFKSTSNRFLLVTRINLIFYILQIYTNNLLDSFKLKLESKLKFKFQIVFFRSLIFLKFLLEILRFRNQKLSKSLHLIFKYCVEEFQMICVKNYIFYCGSLTSLNFYQRLFSIFLVLWHLDPKYLIHCLRTQSLEFSSPSNSRKRNINSNNFENSEDYIILKNNNFAFYNFRHKLINNLIKNTKDSSQISSHSFLPILENLKKKFETKLFNNQGNNCQNLENNFSFKNKGNIRKKFKKEKNSNSHEKKSQKFPFFDSYIRRFCVLSMQNEIKNFNKKRKKTEISYSNFEKNNFIEEKNEKTVKKQKIKLIESERFSINSTKPSSRSSQTVLTCSKCRQFFRFSDRSKKFSDFIKPQNCNELPKICRRCEYNKKNEIMNINNNTTINHISNDSNAITSKSVLKLDLNSISDTSIIKSKVNSKHLSKHKNLSSFQPIISHLSLRNQKHKRVRPTNNPNFLNKDASQNISVDPS